jgi:hypothetical protein
MQGFCFILLLPLPQFEEAQTSELIFLYPLIALVLIACVG